MLEVVQYAVAVELVSQASPQVGRAVSLLKSAGYKAQADMLESVYLKLNAARDLIASKAPDYEHP